MKGIQLKWYSNGLWQLVFGRFVNVMSKKMKNKFKCKYNTFTQAVPKVTVNFSAQCENFEHREGFPTCIRHKRNSELRGKRNPQFGEISSISCLTVELGSFKFIFPATKYSHLRLGKQDQFLQSKGSIFLPALTLNGGVLRHWQGLKNGFNIIFCLRFGFGSG